MDVQVSDFPSLETSQRIVLVILPPFFATASMVYGSMRFNASVFRAASVSDTPYSALCDRGLRKFDLPGGEMSIVVRSEGENGVETSKSESVRERPFDLRWSGAVRDDVQVALRIRGRKVRRRREQAFSQGKNRANCLQRSGSA